MFLIGDDEINIRYDYQFTDTYFKGKCTNTAKKIIASVRQHLKFKNFPIFITDRVLKGFVVRSQPNKRNCKI